MKGVALVALLAAPAALAFTPDNLRGVWSCKTLDSVIQTTFPSAVAVTPVAATFLETDDGSDAQRIVVFDEPGPKVTRRVTGRTYWLPTGDKTEVEEHEFHGIMHNAIDGEFFLDPNSANEECYGAELKEYVNGVKSVVSTGVVGVAPALTTKNPLKIPSTTDHPARGHLAPKTVTVNLPGAPNTIAGIGPGSCSDLPQGPFRFTMDDADHFTLIVDPTDAQLSYFNSGFNEVARLHRSEKCMRGLGDKDEMCEHLTRSGVTTQEEQDNACQGQLVCNQNSNATPWGCSSSKCCSLPVRQIPQYNPTPFYYPNNYYQQPNNWYSPYSSPYYSFGAQYGR